MALIPVCAIKKLGAKRLLLLAPLVPALVLLALAVPRAHAPVTRPDPVVWVDSEDSDARVTLLLVWWAPFGSAHGLPDCEAHYGVRGCALTLDRREYARADALIIHHRELVNEPGALPQASRPEGQKWIWMNFESPSHSPWLDGLEGIFNLTMSYHFGSDIFLPYGFLQRRSHANTDAQMNHHANGQRMDNGKNNGLLSVERHGNTGRRLRQPGRRRPALVAWVISNWSEKQDRVQYYWRLSRYIRVDIYGREALRLVNDSVLQTISGYKFYLAFENSLHTDYITEKLWRNALLSNTVPVVLGPPRENYEQYLPPDAFIHVHDFKSPRALAAYLMYLDQNPAQYHRYLAWRRDYTVHVTSFWAEHYCKACQGVQASRKQQKTVRNLEFWFQS